MKVNEFRCPQCGERFFAPAAYDTAVCVNLFLHRNFTDVVMVRVLTDQPLMVVMKDS